MAIAVLGGGWRLASTFLNFLSNCPCLRCDAHSIHERGATRRVIDDAMGWRDSGLSMSLEKPTAR